MSLCCTLLEGKLPQPSGSEEFPALVESHSPAFIHVGIETSDGDHTGEHHM